MTQDELDKKAGELFLLIKGEMKISDPRSKEDYQLMLTAAMLGVEFVADVKRIAGHLELISKGITALVDIQAASYQNGIIVKVANEIEINTQDLSEEVVKAATESFSGEEDKTPSDYSEEEAAETANKTANHDSAGHRNNRTD